MKKTIHIAATLLLLSGMVGCTKQIEFTGEETDPMPVVVSFPEADSTFNVRLSYSRFFLTRDDFAPINDASFSFEVNGNTPNIAVERTDEGVYHVPMALAAGDTMTMHLTIPGKKELTAGCRVPQAPEVTDVEVEPNIVIDTFWWQRNYADSTVKLTASGNASFKLVLHDPASRGNYYAVRAYAIDSATGSRKSLNVSISDDLLYDVNVADEIIEIASTDLSYGKQALFTDERINGQNHTLEGEVYLYSNYDDSFDSTFTLQLQVCTITRDVYLYWATLKSQQDADGDFLFMTEPVQIHTNVTGGIGILGAVGPRRIDVVKVSFPSRIKDPRP